MCTRQFRTVFYARDDTGVLVSVPGCHNWSCPECAKELVHHWRTRVALGVQRYSDAGISDWSFVTITAMGYDKDMADCIRSFHAKWPKLSTRMRRQFATPRYVTIPELHRDENDEHTELSRVHWHIIISIPCEPIPPGTKLSPSARWWKKNSAECGLGYIADAQPCESPRHAGMYAMKYMVKMCLETLWPKGYRRVRTSQYWPSLDDPPPSLSWQRWDECDISDMSHVLRAIESATLLPARLVGKV